MSSQDIYRQLGVAIHEAQAGRKDMAREILLHILRQDPRNETAWGWMATIVETRKERQFCLRKVLDINPSNAGARHALQTDELKAADGSVPFTGWMPAPPASRARASGPSRPPAGPQTEPDQEEPSPLAEDPVAAIEWVLGGAITPDAPRFDPDAPHYAGSYDLTKSKSSSKPQSGEVEAMEEPPLFGAEVDTDDFTATESKLEEILGPLPGIQQLRRAVRGRSRVIRSLEEDEELPRDRWAFVQAGTEEAKPTRAATPGVEEPPEDLFAPPPAPEAAGVAEPEAATTGAAKPRRRRLILLLIVGLVVIAALIVVAVLLTGSNAPAATPTPSPGATPASPTELSLLAGTLMLARLASRARRDGRGGGARGFSF